MKPTRTQFFILLSVIYFTPYFCVLKLLQSEPLLFWGVCFWGLISYILLSYGLLFFLRQSQANFHDLPKQRVDALKSQFLKQNQAQKKTQKPERSGQIAQHIDKQEQSFLNRIQAFQKKEKDFLRQHSELQHQIDKKETILSEYRSTVQEQRLVIEKKHKDIELLQTRISDLKYELENVLQIKGPTQPVESVSTNQLEPKRSDYSEGYSLSASIQDKLNHYVDMATKLNTSYHLAKREGKMAPFSLGSLVIDQRRLFDRLQNEENETLLVYSRDENRLVFVNDRVKSLLGWTPERFLQDFNFLIQKGRIQWSEAIEESRQLEQVSARLLMRSKSGREVLTHCHLAQVPEGVFKGYIIGILESAAGAP